MSESRTPIHLGQADPRLQHNPGCLTLGAGESTLSVRTIQEVASLRHTQSHSKDQGQHLSDQQQPLDTQNPQFGFYAGPSSCPASMRSQPPKLPLGLRSELASP